MGIILGTDILSIANANITAKTADANYPKINVMDFWHLTRTFRAADVNEDDNGYLLKFDMSAAKTLVAVFLNHVNFDKVRIYGHASDLGDDWSTADFKSGTTTISNDAIVGRYKAYIALTAFNYQWLAIGIPQAATAVGSYTTEWQIGTVVLLDSVVTLSKNMSYGYTRTAVRTAQDINMKAGGTQRIGTGSILRWRGKTVFNARASTDETELWTLNALDYGSPIVFYENNSDTSKAYLCVRDDFFEGSYITSDTIQGNTINFREI